MNKIKYNQFLVLALIATGLMAGVIYSLEWPEGRQVASTENSSTSGKIK